MTALCQTFLTYFFLKEMSFLVPFGEHRDLDSILTQKGKRKRINVD
ncbi:ParG domain protein [Providencia alcalifaciens RIMD 1656011]|uniref:ParG domain protein n=1 Tax=Providencia alcalifaciens 205/92 TaxID=1256988 RepID=A0AAV3M7K1_9GAMM|nr:ParG domain protein [Providencia alcalifaciens RIMD 1656011]EUD11715.1 ParG domain protein [Providencia alcalifaciens 205/92]